MLRLKLARTFAAAILGLSLLAAASSAQWQGKRPRAARPLTAMDYASYRLLSARGDRGRGALHLASERPMYAEGLYNIKYRTGKTGFASLAAAKRLDARLVAAIPKIRVETVRLGSDAALRAVRSDPAVEWVQPVAMRYPLIIDPDDPAFNDIDYVLPLEPDFATWFKWDAHLLDAPGAWSVWPGHYYTAAGGKGTDAVKIAVIDTGIDYNHPDFRNAGGTTSNVTGGGQLYRSLDRTIIGGSLDPDAPDEFGHGTHVTGIAAAGTNNGVGTTGNGINAQVISLKCVDAFGNGTDSDVAQAIIYAADAGALIVNISLGSYAYSQAEADAVKYAWNKGTLVVAAAGNDGTNLSPNYPGALSRVLAVSATARSDYLSTYSNWGDYICVAACGGDFDFDILWFLGVFSTMPTYYVTMNDPDVYGVAMEYDYNMGTSMASPQVVGLAALIAGMKGYTQATPNVATKLWQAIQRGADGGTSWDPYYGYGRINLFNSLNLDSVPNPKGGTTGSVTGQVAYKGTPVANASIAAVRVGGGGTFTASSRIDGGYRIANATSGTYNVTATVFGESAVVSSVVVTRGCDIPGIDINVGGGGGGGGDTEAAIGAISVTPLTIIGSKTATATVTLASAAMSGGQFVELTSANPAVAWPGSSSLFFPGGSTSANFTVLTNPVSTPTYVMITATNAEGSQSATVKVRKIRPKSLTLLPTSVKGPNPSTATVELEAPAGPGDIVLTLTSSNNAWAKPAVPTVIVPMGQTVVNFTVNTKVVTATKLPIIKAAANGGTKQATLTVKKP